MRKAVLKLNRLLMIGALVFATIAKAGVAVTDGGQATYSQALAVPPGIAGMQPNLSLSYVEGGINGPLGVGWSVQGLSSITRCPANRATDGAVRGVTFGPNDKLCLDGQRLIQTDAAGTPLALTSQTGDAQGLWGPAVREYRTEKDIFARVRAYGTGNGTDANNGPAYFKVWTKSGQVYEYGTNPNSNANALVLAQGKTSVAVWAVSRISDTLGNTIDFKYEQRDVAWGSGPTAGGPLLGHEWNISEIQYSGNKVVFSYIDRTANAMPDAAETYQMGSKNVSIRRLQFISTYINSPNVTTLGVAVNAVAVKTYKLGYDNGPVTKRSRLVSIQECAGGASSSNCLPATSFDYEPGGTDAFTADGTFSAGPLAMTTLQATSGNYGVIVGDFNGDGRSDFLRWADTPSENRLYLSSVGGTFAEVPVGTGTGQFNLVGVQLFQRPYTVSYSEHPSDRCFMATAADFNGDGLTDILRWASPTATSAYPYSTNPGCPAGQSSYLFLSKGDGAFTQLPLQTDLGAALTLIRRPGDLVSDDPVTCGGVPSCQVNGENFVLGDVNGDGVLDLIISKFARAYGTQTGAFALVCSSDPGCGSYLWLGKPNGTFSGGAKIQEGDVSMYTWPDSNVLQTLDANGDGLTDMTVGLLPSIAVEAVLLSQLSSQGTVSFERRNGFPNCSVYPGRPQFADFNGDGRADLICAQPNVANNRVLLSRVDSDAFVVNALSTTPGRLSLNQAGQDLMASSAVPGARYIAVDFNGDGRADVLRVADAPASNALYVSNGDGTFTQSTSLSFDGGAAQLAKSDGTAEFVIGNFTGRGSVEILRLMNGAATATNNAGKNQLYTRAGAGLPDVLQTVTSPLGLVTRLTRSSLPNAGTRYASDRTDAANKASYPKVDLSIPMQVVTTLEADTGIGVLTLKTEYAYRGLKASYGGRGMLGFREVRQQSPAPNGQAQTVLTQNLQDHPYIGVASISKTYLGDLTLSGAQLLSQTTNSYCDKTSAASATAITSPGTAPAPCATTALVQRPYLYQSVEQGWDLVSSSLELPRVTTTNSFNNSGDPLSIVASTSGTALGLSQTFTKTTTNTYFADNTAGDNWILGRLQRATVQASAPNSLASIPTSAGSSPNATARQGSGAPPPLNPAILSAILQLLLDD